MKKYVVEGYFLVEEGSGRKKDFDNKGYGFAIIDNASRINLLINKGNAYYDLGINFASAKRSALDKLCDGDWSLLQQDEVLCSLIVSCVAHDLEFLDVIPNSFYLNIPNFASQLQALVKNKLYIQYEKCPVERIGAFLEWAEEDLKKVSDYIEKQEKGKVALEKLIGKKEQESLEEDIDDKEAADYDAKIDHNSHGI